MFDKVEGSDSSFLEFAMSGSTYEPIGDLSYNGQKVKVPCWTRPFNGCLSHRRAALVIGSLIGLYTAFCTTGF